jgi:hypothetical protein
MSYPRKQSAQAWAAQLDFASLESKHGLPAGVLTKLVHQESRGDCDALSPKKAAGLCQFMPDTARGLGVNVYDPVSSVNGAAKYLEQMMDMFDGDIDKALAAYNFGPGNMRRLLRNHPNDWKSHLPKETSDYIRKVGTGIGASYVQREATGSLTDEEREAERQRRSSVVREQTGFNPDNMGDLLTSFFFMIIKSALEGKFPEAGTRQASQDVPDGTAVVPSPAPQAQAPAAARAAS